MKSKLKRTAFYQVGAWMIIDYNLKGNELILYAIIYSFSQDQKSYFQGTASYLSEMGNMSKRTVMQTLKSLVKKGLLKKVEKEINGIVLVDYMALTPEPEADSAEVAYPVQNLHTPPMQNLHTPHAEFAHPLDRDIDKDIIEKKENEINKKGYLFFKDCFREKIKTDYIPPKGKNETYQINAIGEIIKLRPNDAKQFLIDCFNLENGYYLNKISPAHILANYSEYSAAIISQQKNPKNTSGGLNYKQVVKIITENKSLTFDNFRKEGSGKNILYFQI